MAKSLSIKNVPDALVRRLRERAHRNHRSLQGELMVIIKEAVELEIRLEADVVLTRIREMGLSTSADASRIIRTDRDAR